MVGDPLITEDAAQRGNEASPCRPTLGKGWHYTACPWRRRSRPTWLCRRELGRGRPARLDGGWL